MTPGAVLLDWREATIDIDIKIEPEEDAVLRDVSVSSDSPSAFRGAVENAVLRMKTGS